MPTKKPKISAYVSEDLYSRLQGFSEENALSLSEALGRILEDYFGLSRPPSGSADLLDLIGKVDAISSRLEALESWRRDSSTPKRQPTAVVAAQLALVEDGNSGDSLDEQGLLEGQILKLFADTAKSRSISWSEGTLRRRRKSLSRAEFEAWMSQVDPEGRKWSYRETRQGVRYFPVDH
jgi:hypothetical protein